MATSGGAFCVQHPNTPIKPRLYPQASALLEMAADGATDASELRERAKDLASRRRFSPNNVEPAGPQRVVQLLFVFVAGGGNELPSGIFAKGCSARDITRVVDELRRSRRPALESARQSQIPQQRAIDFLSGVDFHTIGSAADGWRVTADHAELKSLTWYVVTEDGAPKLSNGLANSNGHSDVHSQSADDSDQAGHLNTLAAVYAEQGDTAKALENLRASVASHGDQIHEADWYVLGRIAEDYRLKSEAVRLYGKLAAPLHPAADDAYGLAQRRLKTLQEK